jgi:hypothetical protein
MKIKILSILTLIFTLISNAQIYHGTLEEDAKGHFKGDISVSNLMNKNSIRSADKTGLLKEYTLKVNVWDYLGEPMEMYAFQWKRNNYFEIRVGNDMRSISLDDLKEYPDLVKRFKDLRPTKVDIGIAGRAGDGSEKNTTNHYKVGLVEVPEEVVPVEMHFTYTVKDVDLLIAREGEFREPTIAGSPPTWNEFFNWSYNDPSIGPAIQFNISEASFKKLSETEQKKRIKKIKDVWKQIKKMQLRLSIKTLEWPELEMIDIIKTKRTKPSRKN